MTRPEFHPDLPFGLIGDWRSMVDAMTEEFLSAMDHHRPKGYDFDEKTSWHIARMNLEEKFMSIQQRNYLYHRGELATIRKTECPKCMYSHPEVDLCPQSEEDLERCWRIAEDKKYMDWAAPSWNFNKDECL